MCLNIGTPKNHHCPFVKNEKVVVLGVPIFKHFRVYSCKEMKQEGRDGPELLNLASD